MEYYLSLGSNLGEREQTIQRALQLIEQQIGSILRCSSYYYSEPWGFQSEHPFCNLCCAVESTFSPLEVLHLTQDIERALGRKHKSTVNPSPLTDNNSPVRHYTDRCIDIDIIRAFDEQGKEIIINCQLSADNYLTLPHPLWEQRDFVRIPMSEL